MSAISRLGKRIAIGFGVFFGLVILAAAIVPFVVDIDTYRPKVVAAANDYLNGKLELGKLSLSLWGQIRIKVDGFVLSDSRGRKVIASKDVFFHVPFLSIFSGSPLLTFRMQTPEVYVLKDKTGRMNVATLMKESPPTAPTATKASPAPTGAKPSGLPSIVTHARLGVEMRNAFVSYKDETTGLSSQVKDLNLILRDVSLNRPTEIEMWADLDTKMGKTLVVRGPAKVSGKGEPKFEGGQFKESRLKLTADFNNLEILVPGVFHKKKGVLANADGAFTLGPKAAVIERLDVKFHNVEITGQGTVTNLGAQESSPAQSPKVQLTMKSNEIALRPWNELVPSLAAYDLGGSASFTADASGATNDLIYHANIALKGVTVKAPNFKAQPHIEATVKVATDQIENFTLAMKAPGNDLKLSGKMISFSKPRVEMSAQSSGLDLDQLIDFPKAPSQAAASGSSSTSRGQGSGSSDTDASLASLRENEMIRGSSAALDFNFTAFKVYGMKMTGLTGRVSFRDLALWIESFKMGLWGGTVKLTSQTDLKPKTPTYRIGAEVSSLDLQQAVASQFEKFKNTLLGKASFKVEGSGSSLNPDRATSNLTAKGSMRIEKATFTTIDVGRIAVTAISQALNGLGGKLPQLRGVNLQAPNTIESKYDLVSSDFTVSGGTFSAPNFFAKAETNRGLDFKGNTVVGLKDYGLKANWEIIDTYNLTKARDLSPEISGTRVEHILAEGNNPVRFPVTVTGTIFSPAVAYTGVPEALAKVALANVGRAAETRVKAELRKKVEEQTKQMTGNAPAPVQDALKKLFGN